ncbi:hypothetical protein Pan14r_16100 [Crateriforma conspicua]|uniref:Uncharacterized protein n=1 Tax=Crateriforma conspicua TaxID=2527996 RepID=A0A5C5Y4U5_9PLAN|nr:hypothetical protein Pan14r_16100 [Crateriforma conspicua]
MAGIACSYWITSVIVVMPAPTRLPALVIRTLLAAGIVRRTVLAAGL